MEKPTLLKGCSGIGVPVSVDRVQGVDRCRDCSEPVKSKMATTLPGLRERVAKWHPSPREK